MATLMEEEAFAAVVDSGNVSTTCSKCFASNLPNKKVYNLSCCSGCKKLYYCNKECQQADWKDHKAECKLLRATAVLPSENARLIARMLEKSKRCPNFKAFNGRTYDSLMDHVEEAKKSPSFFPRMEQVCREVIKFMGSSAPDMDTVFLAYSKKATNSFAISGKTTYPELRGVGLYIGLSVHNHSCRPDAWVISDGTKRLLRTANKDLVYSENLTISYLGEFIGSTQKRRKELQSRYFFTCNCEECLDEELDKKRLSGRMDCCQKSWFPVGKSKCRECGKEVPPSWPEEVEYANEQVAKTVEINRAERRPINKEILALKLDDFFENYRMVLSEHNVNLLGLAELIYDICESMPNIPIMLKYVDFGLPKLRERAYGFNPIDATLLRVFLVQKMRKPLALVKEACQEYLDTVELNYGKDHYFADYPRMKLMELNLAGLRMR